MAGLLDFLNTPDGQGLLSAAFGGLAGARTGQPINSIGRAGLAGLSGYTGAQDREQQNATDAMRNKYMQSQIDDNVTKNAQMVQSLARQKSQDVYWMGGDLPAAPSPDALPASAFTPSLGGMGPVAPMSARPPAASDPSGGKFAELSRQFGIPVDALQIDYFNNGGKGIPEMIMKRGTPDMQVASGYAYDRNKQGAGYLPSLSTSQDGKTSMVQIGPDGQPVISAPQGALPTYNAYALQGARIGSMGKVNMRKNADGTESPVPESSENTALFPGGGDGFPASATAPGSYQQANPKSNLLARMPGESDAQGIYGRALQEAQQRLQMSRTLEDEVRAKSDISGIQGAMAKMGLRSPQAPAGPARYGMTNDQVIANKAQEETQVGTAKADVQSTQGKQAGIDGAMNAFKLVDQALVHPGLSTAVGLSGTVDPRNYIPGTDAKNFDSVAKQLKGNAFLSAFAQLKGGGAITEVEGAKAESAISRLQQAQSETEYRKALKDYQQVIGQGLRRMGVDPANMGGATGSFDDKPATNAHGKMVDALPTANGGNKGQRIRDTTTGKILVSNGLQWRAE